MEPPTKRMRILQSVEVDEENEEYINAKRKQQQMFKGRLESIFDKYGSMHESMSDEIDMKLNRVVVDRGHLRRLKRQVNRKETMLLDTLGLTVGHEPEEQCEDEENVEDSEDELALTQPVKSKGGRSGQDKHGEAIKPAQDNAQYSDSSHPASYQPYPSATSIPQLTSPQAPNTPNPPANLLQLVQFPQTPAGQQAQTAFYTTLTQTINQAIHQAVVPLFASLLPSNFPIPFATAAPPPTTPITTSDKIAPATDPKWFFPPLSAEGNYNPVAQSSPLPILPAYTAVPAAQEAVIQQDGDGAPQQAREEQAVDHQPTMKQMISSNESTGNLVGARIHQSSPARPRRSSPRVEIQRRMPRSMVKKYHFTQEDDVYISKRRLIDGMTWPDIKASKKKWEQWPLKALHNRWSRIKNNNLHVQEAPVVHMGSPVQSNDDSSVAQAETPSTQTHHLPTPSSSEHEDNQKDNVESTLEEGNYNILSSSAHFDEDERDLLSLAGDDLAEDQLLMPREEDTPDPVPEDVVIPSIETRDFIDEDQLQQDLLASLPMRGATLTPTLPVPVKVKIEPVISSPVSTREPDKAPINFGVVPGSEADDDEDGSAKTDPTTPTITSEPYTCSTCHEPSIGAQSLVPHQQNSDATHNVVHAKSSSIDLVDDDNLSTPATPQIKRETSTPPANFLSTLQTPMAQSKRLLMLDSSGSKSASKANRKTYLKQIKQSWTRKNSPAPKSVAKRKSFPSLGARKRAWVDDDDDDMDELAM
ncbi:Scm3 multi-domain protein [Pyrenophora teres f. maculata]|nr:Scm3 multi-domain protein [Pyrenophora teres f. maculata]